MSKCMCDPECSTEIKKGDRTLSYFTAGAGGRGIILLSHIPRAIDAERYRDSVPAGAPASRFGTSPTKKSPKAE